MPNDQMLTYFFKNDLVNYVEKDISDWREAIAESCMRLLEKKVINHYYIEELIDCVEQYGAYILLAPQVAMPHSSQKSPNVFGTAIAFTKFKQPIQFDDSKNTASLFFTLAAKEPNEHLKNIQQLTELLMTEGMIESLLATTTIDEYREVMAYYEK